MAGEKTPTLEVAGIKRDIHGQGVEFLLRCAQPAMCGSFVVHVQQPELSLNGYGAHSAPVAGKTQSPSLLKPKESSVAAGQRKREHLAAGGLP